MPPAIRAALTKAESLMLEGQLDEANATILAAFPEKSRTAEQALILANILFKQDPKNSYALHQRAAKELPDKPEAQYEWALEQHRAGEYGAAADTYARFLKVKADHVPAYGLLAECLIRTGKTREAADAWAKSEEASGSIETLESLVCEVHTAASGDRLRAELLPKAAKGDLDAAERLVVLDANFERDWWNDGPHKRYLEHDLAVLRKTDFAGGRGAELVAAAEASLAGTNEDGGSEAAAQVLKKAGFMLDEKGTLPQGPRLIPVMLDAVLSAKAISKDDCRGRSGARRSSSVRRRRTSSSRSAPRDICIKARIACRPSINSRGTTRTTPASRPPCCSTRASGRSRWTIRD